MHTQERLTRARAWVLPVCACFFKLCRWFQFELFIINIFATFWEIDVCNAQPARVSAGASERSLARAGGGSVLAGAVGVCVASPAFGGARQRC